VLLEGRSSNPRNVLAQALRPAPGYRALSLDVGQKMNCCRYGRCYLQNMSVVEQIREMPLHEKILTMEALWDDLARDADGVEVPEWHKDILDHRECLIEEGKARFIDWEQAKKEIWQETR
jgi:hypothetical protein